MKAVAGVLMVLAVGCSGRGEVIPVPSPAPETPTSAEPGLNAAPGQVEEEPETVVDPDLNSTPTDPGLNAWGPVLCPYLPHPAHHSPCPTPTTAPRPNLRMQTNISGELAGIRACESHNDYSAVSADGRYYGAYQFAPSTWASVGGSGNPAEASPSEQDMRAQMMIDAGRRSEWPNC